MAVRCHSLAALGALGLTLLGCTGGSSAGDGAAGDGGIADGTAGDGGITAAIATSGQLEPGVWRELVTIDAPAPPANPKTGEKTPARYDKARYLRYRAAKVPRPVKAIVIAMPGMPAGAMAYDQLARELIKLSNGEIELWAIDRRANLLEDLTGMQAAEIARRPELAWKYYDEGMVIDGRRYAGTPTKLGFMSEWGLGAAIADLRAVLAQVPEAQRGASVVLVGHSFGAAFVQAFAAWDIAGKPAAEQLAGIALLDGGVHLYRGLDEKQYLEKGTSVVGGLNALRGGRGLYLDYFGFGEEVFMTVEVTALRAWLSPHAVVADKHVDRIGTLLFLRKPPKLTGAAAVGFALDDASSPIAGMRASCGAPKGPVESYLSPLTGETRQRPARSDLTYDWLDHDEVSPPEKTSIRTLARVAHEGPTNRVEWYMPARLVLDVAAVARLDVTSSSWQWRRGLRASRNGEMAAPVLAVVAGKGIVPRASSLDGYRSSIAAKVGSGRPRAGQGRDPADGIDKSGFAIITLSDYAHDDVVHATGPAARRELYRPLLRWILSNVSGKRTIPSAAGD